MRTKHKLNLKQCKEVLELMAKEYEQLADDRPNSREWYTGNVNACRNAIILLNKGINGSAMGWAITQVEKQSNHSPSTNYKEGA